MDFFLSCYLKFYSIIYLFNNSTFGGMVAVLYLSLCLPVGNYQYFCMLWVVEVNIFK